MEFWQLQQMQALPIEVKIMKTQARIREWYNHFNGDVYVSFSGGKDSTVLLDLVLKEYPDTPAVFCDTGLEYPEIKSFVKTFDNVEIIRPKISFREVIEKYGYPVIGKDVAHAVYYAGKIGTASSRHYLKRFNGELLNKDGEKSQFNYENKRYLLDAPFKISDQCCDVMKKEPFKRYSKKTGRKAIIGTMASNSRLRMQKYLKDGCNSFDSKNQISKPMSFWTENDVLEYLHTYSLPYCSVYGDIIQQGDKYHLTGVKGTGCMFCMFGVHLEKQPNRFQRMQSTHPKLWDYCIKDLGCGKVLDYIGVPYDRSYSLICKLEDEEITEVEG